MTTRKDRGMRTQLLVALALKADGFPHAESAGPGRPGRDVLNTVGLAIEVKARHGLNLVGWLRQAVTNAGGDVPALVARPDGMGETTVDDWPVVMRFGDWRALVRAAGYGTPLEEDVTADLVDAHGVWDEAVGREMPQAPLMRPHDDGGDLTGPLIGFEPFGDTAA